MLVTRTTSFNDVNIQVLYSHNLQRLQQRHGNSLVLSTNMKYVTMAGCQSYCIQSF